MSDHCGPKLLPHLGSLVQLVASCAAAAEARVRWAAFYCLGLLADRYISTRGQRKRLLVASCALGALGFALFSLACTRGGVLDFAPDGARVAVIYGASIFGSLWANAATPIYYELAVEATYPVAEGLTTTAITLVQNGFCFAFLLVPEMLPQL